MFSKPSVLQYRPLNSYGVLHDLGKLTDRKLTFFSHAFNINKVLHHMGGINDVRVRQDAGVAG